MAFIKNLTITSSDFLRQHLSWANLEETLVYFGGSVCEGFGNKTSDVDVYVVGNEFPNEETIVAAEATNQVIQVSSNQIVNNVIYDEVRYDFTYLTKESFLGVIYKLHSFNPHTEGFVDELDKDEVDLLHRLRFAEKVNVPAFYDSVLSNIPFQKLSLYEALSISSLFTNVLEDLQGAYQSEDWGTCFFRMRRLVDVAFSAFLAINDETNPNLKWIYRKLERYARSSDEAEILQKYLELQNIMYIDDESVRKHASSCLRYCQKLNDRTQQLIKQKQGGL